MGGINLNRRLVLETRIRVGDGAGGLIDSWQVLGTVWGNVDGRTSVMQGQAGGELSKVRYRIVLRAAPQGSSARPVPGQRFRDGDRMFLIDAVSTYGDQGLYLECWAHEEVLA